FHTNNGGYLDEAGFLYVEGRLDGVIVRGGENLSPGQIEDCLGEHPAVEDVAVFGLPHDERGETVDAAVVLAVDTGTEARQAGVRARWRSTGAPRLALSPSLLPCPTPTRSAPTEVAARIAPTAPSPVIGRAAGSPARRPRMSRRSTQWSPRASRTTGGRTSR